MVSLHSKLKGIAFLNLGITDATQLWLQFEIDGVPAATGVVGPVIPNRGPSIYNIYPTRLVTITPPPPTLQLRTPFEVEFALLNSESEPALQDPALQNNVPITVVACVEPSTPYTQEVTLEVGGVLLKSFFFQLGLCDADESGNTDTNTSSTSKTGNNGAVGMGCISRTTGVARLNMTFASVSLSSKPMTVKWRLAVVRSELGTDFFSVVRSLTTSITTDTLHAGRPARGLLHAEGWGDLLYTDVRSILMVFNGISKVRDRAGPAAMEYVCGHAAAGLGTAIGAVKGGFRQILDQFPVEPIVTAMSPLWTTKVANTIVANLVAAVNLDAGLDSVWKPEASPVIVIPDAYLATNKLYEPDGFSMTEASLVFKVTDAVTGMPAVGIGGIDSSPGGSLDRDILVELLDAPPQIKYIGKTQRTVISNCPEGSRSSNVAPEVGATLEKFMPSLGSCDANGTQAPVVEVFGDVDMLDPLCLTNYCRSYPHLIVLYSRKGTLTEDDECLPGIDANTVDTDTKQLLCGKGLLTLRIKASVEGRYCLKVKVGKGDGTIVCFVVKARMKVRLRLTKQPKARLAGAAGTSNGNAQVGDIFEQQPEVTLTYSDGSPFRMATVFSDLVNDDGTVAPAMSDGYRRSGFDLVSDNPSASVQDLAGIRTSSPSNPNGVAAFYTLGIISAAHGCFRFRFYHVGADKIITYATDIDGELVLSDPICMDADGGDVITNEVQPPQRTTPFSTFANPISFSVTFNLGRPSVEGEQEQIKAPKCLLYGRRHYMRWFTMSPTVIVSRVQQGRRPEPELQNVAQISGDATLGYYDASTRLVGTSCTYYMGIEVTGGSCGPKLVEGRPVAFVYSLDSGTLDSAELCSFDPVICNKPGFGTFVSNVCGASDGSNALSWLTLREDLFTDDMVPADAPPTAIVMVDGQRYVKISTTHASGWHLKAGLWHGIDSIHFNGRTTKMNDFDSAGCTRQLTLDDLSVAAKLEKAYSFTDGNFPAIPVCMAINTPERAAKKQSVGPLKLNTLALTPGFPADKTETQVFNTLVHAFPVGFNMQPAELPTNFSFADVCRGKLANGTFSECCNADADCSEGLVCHPEQRACTQTCLTPCPQEPLTQWRNRGVQQACRFSVGANRSLCSARKALGSSFAAFCTQCQAGENSWSGRLKLSDSQTELDNILGSTFSGLSQAALAVIEVFCGTVPQVCTSAMRAALDEYVALFDSVCSQMSTLVGNVLDQTLDICSTGLSLSVLNDAAAFLEEYEYDAKEAMRATIAGSVPEYALKLLGINVDKVITLKNSMASTPLSPIEGASTPDVLEFVQYPPSKLSLRQYFRVVVRTSISSGAPSFGNKVTLHVSDRNSDDDGPSAFILKSSGEVNPNQLDSWTKPVLEIDRAVAITDVNGIAKFTVRFVSGLSGSYRLYVESVGLTSVKTSPFVLVNPIQSVQFMEPLDQTLVLAPEWLKYGTKSPGVKFPQDIRLAVQPSVQVLDSRGRTMNITSETTLEFKLVRWVPNVTATINDASTLNDGLDELNGLEQFLALSNLVMQGARQLKLIPVPAVTSFASSAVGPSVSTNGTLEWLDVELHMNEGDVVFNVVVLVDGVATNFSEPISINIVDVETFGMKLLLGLVKAGFFLIGALLMVGNSSWHSNKMTIFSALFAGVGVVLSGCGVLTGNFMGPLGEKDSIYLAILSLATAAFVHILIIEFHYTPEREKMNWSTTNTLTSDTGHSRFNTHFDEYKKAEFFKYVKALLVPRSLPPATVGGTPLNDEEDDNDQNGCCRGCGDDDEDDNDQDDKDELGETVWESIVGICNRDEAFFWPQRIVVAFVLSIFIQTVLFISAYRFAIVIEKAILRLPATSINTIYVGLNNLVNLFYEKTGTELFDEDIDLILDTSRTILHEFEQLGTAFNLAFSLAFACAVLVYISAWIVGLASYRTMILKARRGILSWDKKMNRLADVGNYTGIQIANGLVSYVFFHSIFTGAFLALTSRVLRNLLLHVGSVTFYIWGPMIGTVLIQVLCKKLLVMNIITKLTKANGDHIVHRRAFHLYDLIMLFLRMYTGFAVGVARFILSAIIGLFSTTRIDVSPIPAWVERYTMIDTGSKAFVAVARMHHEFSNPTFRVAAWLLVDDAHSRRQTMNRMRLQETAMLGDGRLQLRRVAYRWQLAVMLHRNPSIRKYRKHHKNSGTRDGSDGAGTIAITTGPTTTNNIDNASVLEVEGAMGGSAVTFTVPVEVSNDAPIEPTTDAANEAGNYDSIEPAVAKVAPELDHAEPGSGGGGGGSGSSGAAAVGYNNDLLTYDDDDKADAVVQVMWIGRHDPSSGKTYYENSATQETQWELPAGIVTMEDGSSA